jgi:hypothetical protein
MSSLPTALVEQRGGSAAHDIVTVPRSRIVTAKEALITLALGCTLAVYHYFVQYPHSPSEPLWQTATFYLSVDLTKAFSLLCAFVIADRIAGRTPQARAVYATAALVGAAVGVAIAMSSAVYVILPLFNRRSVGWSHGRYAYIMLETAMLGIATFWVVLDRRRAASWHARMHGAELDRIAAEKRTVQSELQAIQARVEPQFLFDTLQQVRALYDRDAPRAERMLDDLIAYLRAAMPRMRDTTSTVGQELDLVASYLAILNVRDPRLRCSVGAPDAVRGERFPPMMLLPLVNEAMRHGSGHDARTITVSAATQADRLRVRIEDGGGGFAAGPARDVASVRERLVALYGPAAALHIGRGAAGVPGSAEIDVPIAPRSAENS